MAGKKILVVDDEQAILDVLEKKLSVDGYEVLTAATGRDAFEKARSHLPDLILMDIVLPDIEGSVVVRNLQYDQATQRIPVVFLTGIVSRDVGQKQTDITVGGREYRAIGKPFTYRELSDVIHKVLE